MDGYTRLDIKPNMVKDNKEVLVIPLVDLTKQSHLTSMVTLHICCPVDS